MITLQLTTQVPYAREDVVFDYVALGQDLSGYTKILSAVVHKEVIDEFFKVFKSTALSIDGFVLSSSCIVRWFYQKFPENLKNEKSVCAILNLEADTSEFCFARFGQLTYSREMKYGLRDLGGDFENAFLKDVALTLEAYAREHTPEAVGKLYVLASLQTDYPLFEKLRASKNIEVIFVDPGEALKGIKNIAVLNAQSPDFASPIVCLGAVDESQKLSLNLLPEEIRRTQTARAQKWQFLKLSVLAMLNVGLFFLLFFQGFYQNKVSLDELKTKVTDMRARAEEVKRKTERFNQIAQYVSPSVSTVDVVYALYDMTPKEVSFQTLSIDRNDNLTIQGIAETRTSVNDFHRNLINNVLFKDVSLQYAAQRRFFEGEITDFKITAVVKRLKEL
ncbi:MAG: PilN domain-containing protein [Candidatus Omnitrophica bacterium]|nr:PilN domain-containing protein [Candidatus Omnitrophota bacterium]